MRDVKSILLKGLVPALQTATGLSVYTRIPKSASPAYPYIYISDLYQEEIGSKTSYQYNVDTLVQVIYKDATSLAPLLATMDSVLGLVNNGKPFDLVGFEIQQCILNNSTTTEQLTETGMLNIGLIRLIFLIE